MPRAKLSTPFLAFVVLLGSFAATNGARASCLAGSTGCPIAVHMARGTDTIVLEGRLTGERDCCVYSFRARAGQKLYWGVTGVNARAVIIDPHGDADGPGLPNPVPLQWSGEYIFDIHPNLMAEGGYGPFRLTLTIK